MHEALARQSHASCRVPVTVSPRVGATTARRVVHLCRAVDTTKNTEKSSKNSKSQQEPGLGLKAVWVGAEQFGNLVGAFTGQKKSKEEARPLSKLSRAEVLEAIKDDYKQNYFVNGTGDMNAYEDDCLFTDPFSGFKGTQRFKKNVGNFGNFLEDVKLDVLDFREVEDGLCTRWRFGATLKFPWRPRLAAAGRTTHFFSKDTNRVVEHREEWDTEVGRVLQQLLKPGPGKKQAKK